MKHVWTYWGAVWGQLRPALAAQTGWGSGDADPIRLGLYDGLRPVGWPGWVTRSVFPGEIPGRSRLELLGRRRGLDRFFREW